MRRSHLAACVAAAMVAAGFAAMPASAAPSPRSDIRKCRWTRSTRPPSSACASSRHARSPRAAAARHPARRDRPPVARRSTTPTGVLYRKDYTLRGVGSQDRGLGRQRHSPSPPATAGRRSRTRRTVTDAQVADLITEFDSNMYPKETSHLQHASGPRRHQRHPRPRRQRQRRRLHRRRRQDRRADRQRPRRQLLHLPGRADLHRRLLLVAVQRAVRPQRHDDRRLRLGAPHRREPAGRADRRPVHEPPGPAEPLRGHVRARVAAPACTTTPTRSRRPGSTRGSPTSPRR